MTEHRTSISRSRRPFGRAFATAILTGFFSLGSPILSTAQIRIEMHPLLDSLLNEVDTLQRIDSPDITITAAVTARELTFDEIGNSELTFNYNGRHDTLFHFTGWNIPIVPMPNVTYRNIGVLLVIEAAFRNVVGAATDVLEADPNDPADPADDEKKPDDQRNPGNDEGIEPDVD